MKIKFDYFRFVLLFAGIILLMIFFISNYINEKDSQDILAKQLYKAIETGNKDLVARIVKKNKEVIGSGNFLHEAAFNSRRDIAEILIQNGANVNLKALRGDFTPLFVSSTKGDIGMMLLFIKNGADIDTRNNLNKTPLICAAENGQLEAVKLLIQHGADINIKSKFTDASMGSALFYALKKGHYNIVKELLGNGAVADKEYMIQFLRDRIEKYSSTEDIKNKYEKTIEIIRKS